MYISSYLQTATQLLKDYTSHPPFHQYLKNFFKENKKYGSRDRKYISSLQSLLKGTLQIVITFLESPLLILV